MLVGVVEVEARSAHRHHACVHHCELPRRDEANVNPSRKKTLRAQLDEAGLSGDAAQTHHHRTLASSALLVHLGQQAVRRLRNRGCRHSCNNTRTKRYRKNTGFAHVRRAFAQSVINLLRHLLLDRKLGHRVRDLLEQHGAESGIEPVDHSHLTNQFLSSGEHAIRVGWIGYGANPTCLVRTQENVCDKLSHCGTAQSNHVTLLISIAFAAAHLREFGLADLNASKLEPTLHEVSLECGHNSREQGCTALFRGNLAHGSQKTRVPRGLELHARLDDVNRGSTAVGDATAHSATESRLQVVHAIEGALAHVFAIRDGTAEQAWEAKAPTRLSIRSANLYAKAA
mmetsp:Transcript_88572/g.271124  ORF Transcript_88572/g.271124 Transcript_88572/m.271124 type:complete len:342 (+) Transcript_88572:142-1167(+)